MADTKRNGMFHNARCCLAICTPLAKVTGPKGDLIYDPISPLWDRHRRQLGMPTNITTVELFADGLEVGDARNRVARMCLNHKPIPEFLFFLDSDVLVPNDALTKLLFRARTHPKHDVYAGVYVCKGMNPPDPLIYTDNGAGAFWDWSVGDLLTTQSHGIKAVHMGLTLIRISCFQKLIDAGLVHGDGTDQGDEPWYYTTNRQASKGGVPTLEQGTEDIYFCQKVIKAGGSIFVDTSVLAGHHDKNTGITYGLPVSDGPVKRAKWIGNGNGSSVDREEAEKENLKLALDLGAGTEHDERPGYKVYTADLRADTKPDYVMDTRLLNFPDGHWDLVSSRHHLEHIPRYDQETVWREMFRVLKPGGKMEHIVPDIGWAAAHIRDGRIGQEVYDVLYGAQERQGYDREFNVHHFGYTREVARALAEGCGLVDVEVKNWLDDPELSFNLIIRGRKAEVQLEPEPRVQKNGQVAKEEVVEACL